MRKSKIYLAVVIMTIMTGVCGCNFIGKWNINRLFIRMCGIENRLKAA